MKYRLENIGATHFSGEVDVEDEQQLYLEVRKHVASSEISLYTEDQGKTYSVLVGVIGRLAGKCELVS